MSSSKKRPVTGLCGKCLSVGGPELRNPSPSLHTVYVYVPVYSILIVLFTQGRVVVLNQREG
jgi:hypothetical protein